MQNTITEGLHLRKIGRYVKIIESSSVPTFPLFSILALSYLLLYESN